MIKKVFSLVIYSKLLILILIFIFMSKETVSDSERKTSSEMHEHKGYQTNIDESMTDSLSSIPIVDASKFTTYEFLPSSDIPLMVREGISVKAILDEKPWLVSQHQSRDIKKGAWAAITAFLSMKCSFCNDERESPPTSSIERVCSQQSQDTEDTTISKAAKNCYHGYEFYDNCETIKDNIKDEKTFQRTYTADECVRNRYYINEKQKHVCNMSYTDITEKGIQLQPLWSYWEQFDRSCAAMLRVKRDIA